MAYPIIKNNKLIQSKPTKELLEELYHKEKLSMHQIAERLKIGKTSVQRYLQGYKIKIRNSQEGQKLILKQNGKFGGYIKEKLTKRQKQFIIGTLLGDGTLYLSERNINARLKLQHTEKDKEYLRFKHSVMENFVTGEIIRETKFNKKTKRYYSSLVFTTTTHPEFTKFYKLFYSGKTNPSGRVYYEKRKKIVTSEILNKLTPFGLAIWIMDDGHYNKGHKFMALYTMNFIHKEHLLMQNWFKERYDILPKIDYHKQAKKYYLRFNLLDTQKLVKIIRPYVVPSMERKIGANS